LGPERVAQVVVLVRGDGRKAGKVGRQRVVNTGSIDGDMALGLGQTMVETKTGRSTELRVVWRFVLT